MPVQQVDRSYLFDTLNPEEMPRVIVIRAPAGSGKTTLARQLIARMEANSVWHRLDVWQKDITRLHKMSRIHWQNFCADLSIPESCDVARQSAYSLAKAIASQNPAPVYYVLDDIHHLQHSQEAELWLQSLLDSCPAHVHFVFIGHRIPIIEWYQEIGRGHVFSLNISDLQFTVDDVVQMADITRSKAEALVNNYSGWVAAIRLTLDTGLNHSALDILDTDTPESDLFQQLASSYYQQLSLDQQHSVLLASTTEDIPLQLYDTIFAMPALGRTLSVLHKEHLLISHSASGYRFHSLFRDFLQEQFRRTQANAFRQAHLKAAQWYEADDQLESAILHYRDAKALPQAVHLAESVANELLTRGQRHTLLRINELLEEADAPRLRLISAVVLTDNNRMDEAEIQLTQAEVTFRETGDTQRLACVRLQRAFMLQRRGQYHDALHAAQPVLKQDLPEVIHAWAYRITGCSQMGSGQYSQAVSALNKAVKLYTDRGSPYEQAQALQDLSEALIRSGQFTEGVATLQTLIAHCRQGDNALAQAFALNNLGSVFHYTSHYDDALSILEEARDLLPDTYSREAGYVHVSLADIYRDLGRFRLAEHAYGIAYATAQHQYPTLRRQIIIGLCRLALWRGQADEALQWLQSAEVPPLITSINDRVLHLWHELVLLWLDPQRHPVETLLHHIDKLQDSGAVKSLSKVIGIIAYTGIQYQLSPLQEIFRTVIGQLPDTFLQPLVADCVHLPVLKQWIQNDPILWERIVPLQRILLTQLADNKTPHIAKPQQVHVRMLGQDTVSFEGVTLPDSSWTSPQARAFFYCLLLHGAQDKAQLTRRLWRNYDEYQARNALREARQLIKKVLPGLVIVDKKSYCLNPDVTITTDVSRFEDALNRARQLPLLDARSETLYLRAVALYEAGGDGGFLPHLYMNWLQAFRLHYEDLYREALCGVARCFSLRNEFAFAIRHYNKCLELDSYDEAIYREIMRCYATNRQQAQVQITYNRLEEILLDDLDVAPHPDTRALLNYLLI